MSWQPAFRYRTAGLFRHRVVVQIQHRKPSIVPGDWDYYWRDATPAEVMQHLTDVEALKQPKRAMG